MDVNWTGFITKKLSLSSGKENVPVAKLLIGFALPLLNGQALGQGTSDDVGASFSLPIEWKHRKWLRAASKLVTAPCYFLTSPLG